MNGWKVGVLMATLSVMACSKPWQRRAEWDRIDLETRPDVANEEALAGVPDPRVPSTAGVRSTEATEVVLTDVVGGRTSTRGTETTELLEVYPTGAPAPARETAGETSASPAKPKALSPAATPPGPGGTENPSAGPSASAPPATGVTSHVGERTPPESPASEMPAGEPTPNSPAGTSAAPAGSTAKDTPTSSAKSGSKSSTKGSKKARASRTSSKGKKKSKSTARNAPKKSKKRAPRAAATSKQSASQPSLLSEVAKHVRLGVSVSGGRSRSGSSRSSSGLRIKPRVSLTL